MENDELKKLRDAFAGESGDVGGNGLSTIGFWDDVVFGELLKHSVWVSSWLVALVDSNNHRDVSGLNVLNRLLGLGHDSVICSNDQDRDVGDLSSASSHVGERSVTWSV